MRNSGHTEVGLETNNAALLEDVAQNADLYTTIANQNQDIKTSIRKLRCIACVRTHIALSNVALSSSSEMFR